MSIQIRLFNNKGIVLYDKVEHGFLNLLAIVRHIESLQRAYPEAVRVMLDIAL